MKKKKIARARVVCNRLPYEHETAAITPARHIYIDINSIHFHRFHRCRSVPISDASIYIFWINIYFHCHIFSYLLFHTLYIYTLHALYSLHTKASTHGTHFHASFCLFACIISIYILQCNAFNEINIAYGFLFLVRVFWCPPIAYNVNGLSGVLSILVGVFFFGCHIPHVKIGAFYKWRTQMKVM